MPRMVNNIRVRMMRINIMNKYFLLSPLILLCACTSVDMRDSGGGIEDLHQPYNAARNTPPLSNAVASVQQVDDAKNDGWWTIYEDDQLNALIQNALNNAPSIEQSRAKLEQAAAQARISSASLFPTLSVGASGNQSNANGKTDHDFSLSGAANYEIDLWGKNRAQSESNKLLAQSAQEDLRTAGITLSSEITQYWISILALQEEERVLKKQMTLNQTVLDLQKKRYEMGVATLLDYTQQDETVAATQSKMPDILNAREKAENALLILAGKNPSAPLSLSRESIPAPLPLPDAGLQSDLLENRPDIRAAFLDLQSADWAKHAAWAKRLPDFTIGVNTLTDASTINALFDSWILNFITEVTAPVLDGGARRAEQLRQAAIADERYHTYRAVVLNAVAEVEDALNENIFMEQKLFALDRQLNAARASMEQAQLSYSNGNQEYINVLSALNNVQSLELQMVTTKRDLALARIALYRALGGHSWMENYIVKKETSGTQSHG